MLFPSRFFSAGQYGVLGLLLAAALVLTGCGGDTQTVRVDGSSTVFPISRAAVDAYQQENPGSRVTASNSGTSAGFQRFLRGETDVTGASRPIREDELERSRENNIRFIELPVGYDGLTVTTHPMNDFVDCLTVEELRSVWQRGSDIDNWNEIRDDFPDKPLRLYGRSPASGTFDYFTAAINGERGNVRDDYNASDTDNAVVQGVSRDENGMAFFGLSYYENNSDILRLIAIDDEDPETGEGCVLPTAETVSDGTYQPLARPEFIYVNIDNMEANPAVRDFVRFYIENAARFVEEAEYVPFEDDVYARVMERFENRIEGTMFGGGGPTIGVGMGTMLERMNTNALQDEDTESAADDAQADA